MKNNLKNCELCGEFRWMDMRRAFCMTYGVGCVVIGALGAVVCALLGHWLIIYLFDGGALGGGLIVLFGHLLPHYGTQTCMSCGNKEKIEDLKP